jgi:pyruvate,orthophosphate dikinase
MKVGDRTIDMDGDLLKAGDTITIDGGTGEVFAGTVAGSTVVAPEVATLLAWARELGIKIPARDGQGEGRGEGRGQATEDDVVRAFVIKGSSTLESLADAVLTSSEQVQSVLEHLVSAGLVEGTADGFRLTAAGKSRGTSQLAADRDRWGTDQASTALESFGALDLKVKEAVTAWQLREVDGVQVLNDHADAAYDAEVLDRLASLHGDTSAWLSSIRGAPAPLPRYVARLDRALKLACNGDKRFVASPRVDSYHGIWFELHEDLIQLAGRSRA